MKYTMSINEALDIQIEQIHHYRSRYPELGNRVADATKIPPDADRNIQRPIEEINRMIPRGAAIEFMLGIPQPED